MLKFILPTLFVCTLFYGYFRYGGDHVYLSKGDQVSEHAGVTLFSIPAVSGKIEHGVLEIESPYTGIRFVDISHDEEKAIRAKQCGRLKVKLNPERKNWATFEKSGCFLDW